MEGGVAEVLLAWDDAGTELAAGRCGCRRPRPLSSASADRSPLSGVGEAEHALLRDRGHERAVGAEHATDAQTPPPWADGECWA